MTIQVALVIEDSCHYDAAMVAIEYAVASCFQWDMPIDEKLLAGVVEIPEFDRSELCFKWTELKENWKRLAKRRGHGFGRQVHGLSKGPDYAATRKALLYLREHTAHPQLVVLLRDADKQPGRHIGMSEAIGDVGGPELAAACGTAVRTAEAWVLLGVEGNAGTRSTLQEARESVGFDPLLKPDALPPRVKGESRWTAKKVLDALANDGHLETRMVSLRKAISAAHPRSAETGWDGFLKSVQLGVRLAIENPEEEPKHVSP